MTPNGWRTGRVVDFFELQRGFDITAGKAEPGSVPVVSSSGVSYFHNLAKVHGPGVVTGRKGSVGKVYLINEDFWPHDTTLWVKDFKGNEPEYVKSFLEFMRLERFDEASSVPTLNRNNIHGLKCHFPPVVEQSRILAIFRSWGNAIDLTERLIAKKQELRKGIMQRLLTGKRQFPDAKSKFKEVKIGDVLNVRKEKAIPCENEPLYSLTIEDGITPKTERYNREALVKNLAQKAYKKVYPQDIVYNPSNLRWGAIAISRVEGVVLVSPIYEILYLASDQVDMNFLALLLCSERQIRKFACMVEGTLVERMAVKIGVFLKTKISIPEDIEDQIQISRLFGILDREICLLKKKRLSLISQKKGLMQQLLTGKVRVNVPERKAG